MFTLAFKSPRFLGDAHLTLKWDVMHFGKIPYFCTPSGLCLLRRDVDRGGSINLTGHFGVIPRRYFTPFQRGVGSPGSSLVSDLERLKPGTGGP
jgi:hypothetical protein